MIPQWLQWLQDPQWVTAISTAVLGVVTLLVAIIALFGSAYRDRRDRPIIKIGYGNDKPYVIDSYPNQTLTRLFRLKLVNQGKTVAKKCRVKIVSVVAEDSTTKDSLIKEPDTLKWSSAPLNMMYRQNDGTLANRDPSKLPPIYREHNDITPKGGWEFCDLFEIDTRERKVIFISSGRRNFLAEDKSYIATIEISGDNLEPIKKQIKFSVNSKPGWAIYNFAKIEEVRNT